MEWILGVFSSLFDLIVCAIKSWFCWALDYLTESFDRWCVTPLLQAIPEPPQTWDFAVFAGMWSTLDYFFPATESLLLCATYMTAYITVVSFRAVKSYMPGLW